MKMRRDKPGVQVTCSGCKPIRLCWVAAKASTTKAPMYTTWTRIAYPNNQRIHAIAGGSGWVILSNHHDICRQSGLPGTCHDMQDAAWA